MQPPVCVRVCALDPAFSTMQRDGPGVICLPPCAMPVIQWRHTHSLIQLTHWEVSSVCQQLEMRHPVALWLIHTRTAADEKLGFEAAVAALGKLTAHNCSVKVKINASDINYSTPYKCSQPSAQQLLVLHRPL